MGKRKHQNDEIGIPNLKMLEARAAFEEKLKQKGIALPHSSDDGDSDDEFYKLVKQSRDAKLASKAEIFSKSSSVSHLPETADGKRHITTQMEKNRGLTRPRKKQNPRKKYRSKHEQKVKRRKGQVPDMKKAISPYSGEASGINAGISRSRRVKN